MALVPAICTQCGAQIEVDNTKDAGICTSCGTTYITEKAINNYNITNNISANVVNIYGGNSADFVIRAGVLERYNGVETEVVIPSTVSIIGEEAFADCIGLRKVTIPESVTQIMYRSFYCCKNLKDIKIPNSVTIIDRSAFGCCNALAEIVVPNSVREIGAYAFAWCENLRNVVLSESLSEISNGLFEGCKNIKEINIPNGVNIIRSQAFAKCSNLTNILIPDSVVTIEDYVFRFCENLKSIRIPDSVRNISNKTFGYFCDTASEQFIEYIDASGEWKKQHYTVAKCLADYGQIANKISNSSKRSKGCYIATSVYGSYDCPEVWTLRRYRDYTLDETWYGKLFIKCYYTISPMLVKWFGNQKWFKIYWRIGLDHMVAILNEKGIENTEYQDKY